MIDQHLIDEAVAALVKRAGVKIQKDDPILLNALVIQAMLREQVDLTRRISDEMVGVTTKALEESTEKWSADLTKKLAAQTENSGIFVNSLREILQKQAAEKYDTDALAKALAAKLKPQITSLLIVQTLSLLGLLALGAIVLAH